MVTLRRQLLLNQSAPASNEQLSKAKKRSNSALSYDQESAFVDAIQKYNATPKKQMHLDQGVAMAAQGVALPEGGVAGMLAVTFRLSP